MLGGERGNGEWVPESRGGGGEWVPESRGGAEEWERCPR